MKRKLAVLAVMCVGVSSYAQMIEDFEEVAVPFASGKWMFRDPSFSGSTGPIIALTNPTPTSVVDALNGLGGRSGNAIRFKFAWTLGSTAYWVRLSTNAAANKPNPTISFTDKIKFDVYSKDKPVLAYIGVRETDSAVNLGENGGTTGGIEWLSDTPLPGGDATGVTGVNRNPGGGTLIPANTWTTVTIDPVNISATGPGYIRPFAGASANGILTSTTGKGVLEHIGISQKDADPGPYEIWVDNLRNGEDTGGTITGTLDLGGVDATWASGRTFNWELRDGATVVQSGTFSPDSSFNFSITTSATGTHDLYIIGKPFLGKLTPSVAVGATGVTVTMKNGDIDGDNAVTVFDYGVLSDYFDKSSADSDWNTVGANGSTPADADIDGDGSVSVFDYGIISDDFDLVGD